MSDAMRPPGPPDPPRCPTCGKNYPWMAGVGTNRCVCGPKTAPLTPGDVWRERAEAAEARAQLEASLRKDAVLRCEMAIELHRAAEARALAAEADVAALRRESEQRLTGVGVSENALLVLLDEAATALDAAYYDARDADTMAYRRALRDRLRRRTS